MTQIAQSTKRSLPIFGGTQQVPAKAEQAQTEPMTDEQLEAELKAFEEAERERLGLKKERKQWVDNMLQPKMTRKERDNVTLLISGLTAAQDFLVEGALRGLGYNVEYFGISDNAGLQV